MSRLTTTAVIAATAAAAALAVAAVTPAAWPTSPPPPATAASELAARITGRNPGAAALDARCSRYEVIRLLSDHEIGIGTLSRTRGARLLWTGRELLAGA